MVKEYTQEEVDEIASWAKGVNHIEPIKLQEGTIFDVPKYIESHLNDLKKFPNPTFRSAIDRLYKLKEILEGNENG